MTDTPPDGDTWDEQVAAEAALQPELQGFSPGALLAGGHARKKSELRSATLFLYVDGGNLRD
jgi:hypothetical protein